MIYTVFLERLCVASRDLEAEAEFVDGLRHRAFLNEHIQQIDTSKQKSCWLPAESLRARKHL